MWQDMVFIQWQFSVMHECLRGLFNERAVSETRRSSSCQRVNVSSGQKAEQRPPLHHQQQWQWRGLHRAQSLWLLTSVWWGSYQSQRSMETAFMKEKLCMSVFCMDGLSHDHQCWICNSASEALFCLLEVKVSLVFHCRWCLINKISHLPWN